MSAFLALRHRFNSALPMITFQLQTKMTRRWHLQAVLIVSTVVVFAQAYFDPLQSRTLPWDPVPTNVLQASPKKVFSHYFSPFPISIDNLPASEDYYTTQYINPYGENGKHAAYGGYLRCRPPPRAPVNSTDWEGTIAYYFLDKGLPNLCCAFLPPPSLS